MEFAKQLIHWFTSNQQKENPDTMALLDAILDGLVDPENGSLRSDDLSPLITLNLPKFSFVMAIPVTLVFQQY